MCHNKHRFGDSSLANKLVRKRAIVNTLVRKWERTKHMLSAVPIGQVSLLLVKAISYAAKICTQPYGLRYKDTRNFPFCNYPALTSIVIGLFSIIIGTFGLISIIIHLLSSAHAVTVSAHSPQVQSFSSSSTLLGILCTCGKFAEGFAMVRQYCFAWLFMDTKPQGL
jgi:hypothetical protein